MLTQNEIKLALIVVKLWALAPKAIHAEKLNTASKYRRSIVKTTTSELTIVVRVVLNCGPTIGRRLSSATSGQVARETGETVSNKAAAV